MQEILLTIFVAGYLVADFLVARALQTGDKSRMFPVIRLVCGIVCAGFIVGYLVHIR